MGKERKLLGVGMILTLSASCMLGMGAFAEETETEILAETDTESLSEKESETELEYDFKKFCWGDAQELIEKEEGEPYLEDDMTAVDAHYIAYETTVAGKDAVLAYYFCDEGLFRTRYILTEEHSNEELYIDDYEDVQEALEKKYGEPTLYYEDWQDDSKKSYYAEKKGDALCYGYLNYYTYFRLDRSLISMEMSADNYDISTSIDFTSMEISPGEADYSDDF